MKNFILTIALLAFSGPAYGMQKAKAKEGLAIHTMLAQQHAQQQQKAQEEGLPFMQKLVKKHEKKAQKSTKKQTV